MLLFRLCPPIICNSDRNGRILKSDQSGRSLRVLLFPRPAGVARQVSILSQLKVGESAILVALNLPESVQNHLMHMGFVPGGLITVLRRAPAGDPTVYCIDGMEIALRHETAEAITVRPNVPAAVKASDANSIAPELEVEPVPQLLEAVR
jgi:ferrous iron transport protein A